jgi:peptide/nickel transport system substrate-binding protein
MGSWPERQGSSRSGRHGRMLAVGVGAVALALGAAACSSSTSSGASSGTPVKGGTAVMAEPPSQTPNYIFPFMSTAVSSNQNLFDFTYLMYRPLYWFGDGAQPTLNTSLSLADPATFSGTKVTITLKHYMWSDGTPVTAQDVVFWINMMRAVPQGWFGSSPGGFPTNVSDVKAVSATQLTMTMNKSYSSTWFQYNELSQVTPMPAAWDRTASGPRHCATTVSDCAAVYSYLNGQAKNLSGYATSPIWSIVDGPWKLSAFSADGHVTFVPNKTYSGPVKPHLAQFQEVPFTTDTAEYNVLQSSSSSSKIDVGYIPAADLPAKPPGVAAGANPLAAKGYTLAPLYAWGMGFYWMNLQSTTGNGPVIRQLYFRQAMAYLMDQQGVISGPLRGYGSVTVGPVAATPVTKFLSPKGRQGDPFPFSVAKAKALLSSHGWKVVPGGSTSCVDPARCGPGIAQGKTLSFNFRYANGTSWLASEMTELQSNAAQAGIKLNLQPQPIGQVIAVAGGNCVTTKIPCNWDMADIGGFTFSPDYLPTGDVLFLSGAVQNSAGYSSAVNDAMIEKTLTSANLSYMYAWQDYLSMQMPFQWQPFPAYQLTEVANKLKGVIPQSPTLSITPETWYFVK